ncbi:MAG: S-layer protein [Candidatus Aenigmatarchaeota archaeon]
MKGYLRVVLGEVTQQVVGGGKYKELDVTKLSVPVAKFDDEVPTDASLTKNLVVVGGPYVNRVAAALLNIPYQAGDQIKAYYESLGAMNKGLVKAFDNVFGSGKVALLVAGWRAEDTRLTASVLQQYDKFLAQLAQGDTLVIGGTVESPTITAPQTGATQ